MIVTVNGVVLDVPDDASPDEIDGVFQDHLKEMAAGTAKSMGPAATMKPVQQIPGGLPDPLDLGQTIRAAGSQIPGAEPLAAAGDYVQNLVTGTPQTWEGTLAARRRAGSEAGGEEPGAAAGGALLSALRVPWAQGRGPIPLFKRALQAFGLSGATELSKGRPIEEVVGAADTAAVTSGALDAALHIPGALKAAGPVVRGWAAERAWRAGSPTDKQAQAVAEALDPLKISGKKAAGEFVRDLKLDDGTFVLQGSEEDVYRNLMKYLRQEGARKGGFIADAEARGAKVDTDAVMNELDGILRKLDAKEIQAANPNVKTAVQAFRDRIKTLYGDKPLRPMEVVDEATGRSVPVVSRPGSGATSGEIPTGFREPSNPQSQLLPPEQTTRVPIYEGANAPGSPSTGASPAMMAEAEEGSALAAPEIVASYERTGPAPFAPTHYGEGATNRAGAPLKPIVRGDRVLSQETTRPAPDSGWSPVLLPPESSSLTEWESLKTALQKLVEDTRAGLNRSDDAITADPVLQSLRGFGTTIKNADEAAVAKVFDAPEMEAFLRSKRAYGTASELEPLYQRSLRGAETARPGSAAYESRRVGHALPAVLMGAGGFGGGAGGYAGGGTLGGIAGAVAGAGLGYGMSRGVQAFENANPAVARLYDAAGRAMSNAPNVNPAVADPTVAALMAYLRNQETAR